MLEITMSIARDQPRCRRAFRDHNITCALWLLPYSPYLSCITERETGVGLQLNMYVVVASTKVPRTNWRLFFIEVQSVYMLEELFLKVKRYIQYYSKLLNFL